MRFGSAALGLIVLVIAIAFPSWAGSPDASPLPSGRGAGHSGGPGAPLADVTLGLYSGRPDPHWPLDASGLELLMEVIESLPEVAGAPPAVGLGYHGFFVESPLVQVRVYPGAVVLGRDEGERYRADEQRSVERLLLETGRPFLAETEIRAVEERLAPAASPGLATSPGRARSPGPTASPGPAP